MRVDARQVTFDDTVKTSTQGAKSSTRQAELDRILSADVSISSRQLGELLGVSHETANQLKKEWIENHKAKEPTRSAAGTLTKAEAAEMKETLAAAFEDDFRYLDEYLWSRQKAIDPDCVPEEIWSNVDEEECQKLTGLLIRAGQHSPAAATVARGIVSSRDYIVTAAILAPRIKKTFDVVRATHRPPKKRGEQ